MIDDFFSIFCKKDKNDKYHVTALGHAWQGRVVITYAQSPRSTIALPLTKCLVPKRRFQGFEPSSETGPRARKPIQMLPKSLLMPGRSV